MMGCRGRAFWDCTGLNIGCLRKDLKEARRHSGNSGKKYYGQREGKGHKDQSHLNTLLVSALVWPCHKHGPAQPILVFLLKSFLTLLAEKFL